MVANYMIAAIVLDTLAVVANFIEQVFICSRWSHVNRIDHILLSLSISDILSASIMLYTDCWFYHHYIRYPLEFFKDLSTVTQVFDVAFLFSVFVSNSHVIAIAVERLYAIRFPRKYHIFTSVRTKRITIFTVWFVSALLTSVFAATRLLDIEYTLGNYIKGIAMAICGIFVFITYMYIAFLLIKQRYDNRRDFSTDSTDGRLCRLTIICLFIGISFVVCLTPSALYFIDGNLWHPVQPISLTLNSVINPLVYFVKLFYEARQGRRASRRPRSITQNTLMKNRSGTVSTDLTQGSEHHQLTSTQ